MPKPTFFNLPDEKRQKFLEASIYEFALFDYNAASVSRIVKTVNIAKGSLYQYFENKADLYFYLIDTVSQKKLEYINRNLEPNPRDFYSLYKNIILTACRFDLSFPAYSRMMYNVGRESYNPEIGDVSKRLMEASAQYLSGLVEKYQEEGSITKDLDKDFIAFAISYLSVDIGDYIARKFHFSYLELIHQGAGKLPVSDQELGEVLDDLIRFYRFGLEPGAHRQS